MSIEELWNDYELFFHHEFVNFENFPKSKLELLRQDRGHYFINNDFTIYQEKSHVTESINETDYHRNLGTFIVILYNLPVNKVKDFIEFHYNNYNGYKEKFLEFVYHELNGSKSTRGGIEIPPPQQKLITMEWCKNKLDELNSKKNASSEEGIFFSGQNFDALLKFSEIIAKAKSEIILIDNYLDEKILEMLGSKNIDVKCKVLTLKKSFSNNLKAFVDAFNRQHKNLEVKTTSVFHDRFIILDKSNFYHFGASIKDAGNKGFMFSKIEKDAIKKQLLQEVESEWSK